MNDDRDQLVRLLTLLENQPFEAGRRRSRRQRKALAACRTAIKWLDLRPLGSNSFLWGSGGLARNFAIFIGLGCLGALVTGPGHLTAWNVVGELLIAIVFGLGGGAFAGRLAWRGFEENYTKQLDAAMRLSQSPTLPPN
jgi:hypothetical protein